MPEYWVKKFPESDIFSLGKTFPTENISRLLEKVLN